MDDSEFEKIQNEVSLGISKLSNAIKVDVEDLLNDVVNVFEDLQKNITQPFKSKNTSAREILRQVDEYNKRKLSLKNQMESKLTDVYNPKWRRYLQELSALILSKVDDMLEESSSPERKKPGRSPTKVSFSQDQSSVTSWRNERHSENMDAVGERVPRVLLSRCSSESAWRNQSRSEDMEIIEEDEEEEEEESSRLSPRRSVRETIALNSKKKSDRLAASRRSHRGATAVNYNELEPEELFDEEEYIPSARYSPKLKRKQTPERSSISRSVRETVAVNYNELEVEDLSEEEPTVPVQSSRSYGKIKRKRSPETSPVGHVAAKKKPKETPSKLYPSLEEFEEVAEISDTSEEQREESMPRASFQRQTRRSVLNSEVQEIGVGRRTKRSVGRMSTPSQRKSSLFDTGTETKKTRNSIDQSSSEQTKPRHSRSLSSLWIPLTSVPESTSELPAVYQIKVHQAKKPAYIGFCSNLRSQLMKYQKGESTGKKQLDKYIQRNYDSIEIQSEVRKSVESAKEECQALLDDFNESNNKLPAFNN